MKKFSRFCSKSNGSAVKRFVEILLIVVALVAALALFAACNGSSGSAPSTDSGTGSAGQTTVGQIYLESGVSLDRQALIENETQEIAVSAFGEGSTVLSFGIEQGTLFVISLNGGALSSVVVSLPEEVVDIINDELSSVLLKEANLTQNQTVSASEKEQVKQKLFDASQSVQSQIGEVSSLTYGTQNSYITGSVRQNGSGSVSVLGAVRSDGSVLLFDVLSDGKLSQSVFEIENAQSMTEDELWQAVTDGSLQPASQSDIDLSAVYAPPAVETISFDEIYNEVFGENYVVPTSQEVLEEILVKAVPAAENHNLIVADVSNENFTLYFDATVMETVSYGYTLYKQDSQNLNNYISVLTEIDKTGSFEKYLKLKYGDGSFDKNSEEYQNLLSALQSYKSIFLEATDTIGEITSSQFSTKTLITQTTDTLPAPSNDFGEALLNDLGENGEIVETYVGDVVAKQIDDTNIFGTGYYMSFGMAVVYTDGSNVLITQSDVIVPWYTNSTNQSQYNEFVSENGRYQLRNTETTTITAPVYVAGEATL